MKFPLSVTFLIGCSLLKETLSQDFFPPPPAPAPSSGYYSKGYP